MAQGMTFCHFVMLRTLLFFDPQRKNQRLEGSIKENCKSQRKFQSAQPTRIMLAILDEPQIAIIVLYPFIQNNRAEAPLSVVGQLSLQLLASVDETHVASRIRKVAVTAVAAAAAAGDLERLARVDEVRVVDVVVAGNLVKGAVEAGGDGAEGVSLLDGDGGASATLSTVDPAEAAVVVLEDPVEGDGAVVARAIHTSA